MRSCWLSLAESWLRWTTRNPPNYVERDCFLPGQTPDSGRIWDLAAAARYFAAGERKGAKVWLAGDGLRRAWRFTRRCWNLTLRG